MQEFVCPGNGCTITARQEDLLAKVARMDKWCRSVVVCLLVFFFLDHTKDLRVFVLSEENFNYNGLGLIDFQ